MNACSNVGNCTQLAGTYTCSCYEGYSGPICKSGTCVSCIVMVVYIHIMPHACAMIKLSIIRYDIVHVKQSGNLYCGILCPSFLPDH